MRVLGPLFSAVLIFLAVLTSPASSQSGDELKTISKALITLNRAGRYAQAIPVARRYLVLVETLRGKDHADYATGLNVLARLFSVLGRHTEAEPLYKQALQIYRKTLGVHHPRTARSLNNLASLYEVLGRYSEAERFFKQSLTVLEKALGPKKLSIANSLNNLAGLYNRQGRYEEAEPLYKRSLAILEPIVGLDHPRMATALNNLAFLYRSQKRYKAAGPLYKRALNILEKKLGPNHIKVARSLNNLAELYVDQKRYRPAEPLYKRSLAIRVKTFGRSHLAVAVSLNNLAALYRAEQRSKEAEPLFLRALKIQEQRLGADHDRVATSLSNLGVFYLDQGRYAQAEPLYKRALAIREKALGPYHPLVGNSLNNLAVLSFAQSDWQLAADYWRRSIQVITHRSQHRSDGLGKAVTSQVTREADLVSHRFRGLIKAAHRLQAKQAGVNDQVKREMFQVAQWSMSSQAAGALAQMSVRQAKGSSRLAILVRQRQDLVRQWQKLSKRLDTARSRTSAQGAKKMLEALVSRLNVIDQQILDRDAGLIKDFPDYAAMVRPEPLDIKAVQAQLLSDEALILFLDTLVAGQVLEETFVWVVTKTDSQWVSTNWGTKRLREEVKALRIGLDVFAGYKRGLSLSEPVVQSEGLPFDLNKSHELYEALFGQIKGLIHNKKHLLIVPSGPLTSLPFQVLITKTPGSALPGYKGYSQADWLIKSHALTVLPSVASLKALRQHKRRGELGSLPFMGFGNPLLLGPSGADRSAFTRQSCPVPGPLHVAKVNRAPRDVSGLFRARRGLTELIRSQHPLPETADELCAVGEMLGARRNAIYLGAKATEAQIKQLSEQGLLGKARILHFATHGLLAGETGQLLKTNAEPALLLTPPDHSSQRDDGLLTASEVTTLKLNADWVIMSACNTAGADHVGAEALSGLARAFFYAGARALLVSHWYVNSDATVALITGAFNALRKEPGMGRSEAMRRAMLRLIEEGGENAHPSNWAPFVVVGEGKAL